MGVSVPSGDDTQAKAREKLALLKALSCGSGDNVQSESSCLLFPFLEALHDMFESAGGSSYHEMSC